MARRSVLTYDNIQACLACMYPVDDMPADTEELTEESNVTEPAADNEPRSYNAEGMTAVGLIALAGKIHGSRRTTPVRLLVSRLRCKEWQRFVAMLRPAKSNEAMAIGDWMEFIRLIQAQGVRDV
jgi:hypothetical protein